MIKAKEYNGLEAEKAFKNMTKVKTDLNGWRIFYADKNEVVWILDYPDSEYHGGGSPRLRKSTLKVQDII